MTSVQSRFEFTASTTNPRGFRKSDISVDGICQKRDYARHVIVGLVNIDLHFLFVFVQITINLLQLPKTS